MRRSIATGLVVGSVAAVALTSLSCTGSEIAYGDVNSIIVGADPGLWAQVEDTVMSALQPTITTTVKREEVFQVTYQDPADSAWGALRLFRQILLIGSPEDPWMTTALGKAQSDVTPPGVTRADNVWARNQLVTLVVLPDDGAAKALEQLLPALRENYLELYRQWAHSRMFVSGRDSALADTLMETAGFSLLLPEVYRWERRDSVFIFRNDNPDPSELIRQFTLTWMTPIPDTMTVQDLLAWREGISRSYYDPVQVVNPDTALMSLASPTVDGREAQRLQAVWENPPDSPWPAAGNFIIQAVRCPNQDRLYLIDAWLYAPGKDKFEYLYQLETVLDSFRCGDEA